MQAGFRRIGPIQRGGMRTQCGEVDEFGTIHCEKAGPKEPCSTQQENQQYPP